MQSIKSSTLAALLVCGATTAFGQAAVPDVRGAWVAKGKSVVFGVTPHNPGTQTQDSPPRIRDNEFTYTVEGQEGRLVWGRTSSNIADTREPFVWAISTDGKTIVGSDTDGSYFLTVQSADLMELCYTHTGLNLSKSIVATCWMATRQR